jgi:hypothetical protein
MDTPAREAQKIKHGAVAYTDDDDRVLAELGYVVSLLVPAPTQSARRRFLSSPWSRWPADHG